MDRVTDLKNVLTDYLNMTIQGKISWSQINPNAIRWIKPGAPQATILTLQRQPVATPRIGIGTIGGIAAATVKDNYVLTIQGGSINIQITTAIENELRPQLEALFNAGLNTVTDKTVETLKKLLNGL